MPFVIEYVSCGSIYLLDDDSLDNFWKDFLYLGPLMHRAPFFSYGLGRFSVVVFPDALEVFPGRKTWIVGTIDEAMANVRQNFFDLLGHLVLHIGETGNVNQH